jgi:predicted GNAT family acetyltransferase
MEVINNVAGGRFEIDEGSQLASLRYSERNRKLYLIHTEVPEALQGRSYASTLARTALEYAKREHLRVVPVCPFVRAYLRRHPEYASLVEHE